MPQDSLRLNHLLGAMPGFAAAQRFVVAFSGGLDSTALLHALATCETGTPILALHVRHDLHADAAAWEKHCAAFAGSLSVDYESRRVQVPRDSGQGLEAAARSVRYEAIRSAMTKGDWVLSAHHQDDQAETLLLNLLRGSGPAGLAGIGAFQPLGAGHLVRPLLHLPRSALEEYVAEHRLPFLQDSSNNDSRFDRNYLRAEIVPRLLARWPAARERLAHSATLAGDAAELLAQMADSDLAAAGRGNPAVEAGIALSWLATLSAGRARNVLRRAIRLAGLPPAPETCLREILLTLLPARDDALPQVSWSGAEARRYRDRLYLMPMLSPAVMPPDLRLCLQNPRLDLGEIGELELSRESAGRDTGLSRVVAEKGLSVRLRVGGESFCPLGSSHTRELKKLLQEAGIAPWLRDRIPLLFDGDQLAAVADMWLSKTHAEVGGYSVIWHRGPATVATVPGEQKR